MAQINGWTLQVNPNGRFGIYLSEDGSQAVVKNGLSDLAFITAHGTNVAVHAQSATILINHENKTIQIQPSVEFR
ncbi:hypothetical protein [Alicyclobacillus macrosporangiidus]|uniref:hypothetical protein n=1 Tax=Alicyclobacillus macrosporangiidus TaxID=392015 RepID=UPI0004977A3E|nr:hypothetical protein [Alicyclobacillus macrosporangiidus]